MNSEKVKEIKKNLKEEIILGEAHNKRLIIVELDLIKNALTLINELESENERLTKQYVDWKDLYYENTKRVKKLKDRIAELEKENEILQGTKNRLTFADRIKLVDNAVEIKLKQFAERVAKRLININGIKQILDETLKEFLEK